MNEFLKQGLAVADSIAARLHTPAVAVWQAYVGQARVQGTVSAIQLVLLVVLDCWFFGSFMKTAITKSNAAAKSGDDDAQAGWMFASIVPGLALVVISIFSFFALTDVVTQILNPNYWALQKLLGR